MREPWEHEWKDYYGLLGLDPSAEAEVVAGAYKALARKYHPDKSPDPHGRKMKLLNEAYEVLSDPERRSWYDREYTRREGHEATEAEGQEARAEQAAREEAERQRAAEQARRREEAEREAEAARRRREETETRQAEEDRRRAAEEEKRRVAAKQKSPTTLPICLFVGVGAFIVLCIALSGGHGDERTRGAAKAALLEAEAARKAEAEVGAMRSAEVDCFVAGLYIRFSQIDPASGLVTTATHIFRELSPNEREPLRIALQAPATQIVRELSPNEPRVFVVKAEEEKQGKINLYSLRNIGTGEAFDFRDVPVRKIGTAGWVIEPEVGWKVIRDELQAKMKVQLAMPIIGR